MIGLNRHDGGQIKGRDRLRQSIMDVLTTPIGTRVMRRDYGSRVPDYVDRPMNDALMVDLYAETAIALAKWIKDFELKSARVTGRDSNGRLVMDLYGKDLISGRDIVLDGIVL